MKIGLLLGIDRIRESFIEIHRIYEIECRMIPLLPIIPMTLVDQWDLWEE